MACSWCGKTPVAMQRLTDHSYYCGVGCFVAAWRGHAAQHRTGITLKGPRADDTNEWATADAEGEAKSEQKWVLVADTQSYTPSVDDVGHMLKLACVPYSADGSQKGIGKTLKTSYVIAPPPAPPPRRIMLIRNNVAVSMGKPGTTRTNSSRIGFTMLTYEPRLRFCRLLPGHNRVQLINHILIRYVCMISAGTTSSRRYTRRPTRTHIVQLGPCRGTTGGEISCESSLRTAPTSCAYKRSKLTISKISSSPSLQNSTMLASTNVRRASSWASMEKWTAARSSIGVTSSCSCHRGKSLLSSTRSHVCIRVA